MVIVFNLGQRFSVAEMQQPLKAASREFRTHSGRSAYMVTSRAPGAGVGSSLLPAAVAAEPASPAPSDSTTSGESAADRQIDDLLNSDSPAATFQQVYLLLKDQFVDHIPSDTPLAHGAASAMLASLDDPNSRFIDANERQAVDDQSSGRYAGVGIVWTVRKVELPGDLLDRQITVIDALPGSPADRAGLRTGDVITSIDGHWIISYDPFQAQATEFKKLANDPYDLNAAVDATEAKITDGFALDRAQSLLDVTSSQPLMLTVHRPGQAKPLQVRVALDTPTQVKDVEYRKLPGSVGYIAFNAFTDSTATDFQAAVDNLGNMKGLVIDLRDCPGGVLDPAVEIGKALSASGRFAEIDVRAVQSGDSGSGKNFEKRLRDLDTSDAPSLPGVSYHGPISVLVNRGTANSAELLAAFLHDRDGARIVGRSTFGDGSAQTMFPLGDGSAILLTTGTLKTDDGVSFDQAGLAPQYLLADAGHAGDGPTDPCIDKGVALLALGAAPPGPAGERPIQAAEAPIIHASGTKIADKETAE